MFWTAFTIGLFGSLHCIGMCGPIALAMPLQGKSRWQLMTNSLLYNLGRVVTYTIFGVFIGIIGEGIVFAGLQKILSILTGVSILLVLIFSINIEKKVNAFPIFQSLYFKLKIKLSQILKKGSNWTTLSVGLLNGLLPCGLVYLAMAGALSAGALWQSSLYMFSFGLGTIPLMLAFILIGNTAHQKYRIRLQKLYPAFLVVLAAWFIFRGVAFYLPPDFKLSAALEYLPLCH
jgi:sulfite exporter TauE/SafE